jgi:hypothetical protein
MSTSAVSMSPSWRVFFVLAAACNVWHTAWRALYGGDFMGMSPNGMVAFVRALDSSLVGLLPRRACMVYDVVLWIGVGSGGVCYLVHAVRGLPRWVMVNFAGMKAIVSSSLLLIALRGVPGPYTLVFGLLELVWCAGFLIWAHDHSCATGEPLSALPPKMKSG